LAFLGVFTLSNSNLTSVGIGFFTWDLFFRLLHYKEIFAITNAIHHVSYISGGIILMNWSKFLLPGAPYVFCGEISSVLLDLRWFLCELKMQKTLAYPIVNTLFASSFFVTRVCILGVWTWRMCKFPGPWSPGSYYCIVSGVGLYILNLYWFAVIAKKVKKMLIK